MEPQSPRILSYPEFFRRLLQLPVKLQLAILEEVEEAEKQKMLMDMRWIIPHYKPESCREIGDKISKTYMRILLKKISSSKCYSLLNSAAKQRK